LRTKKDLEFCIWGVEKEGDSIVYFEKAILEKYPPPHKNISQFDSMLVGQIQRDSHIWRHHVLNFIFLEELNEPLQHLPSIFVIYLPNHFVTLVVDGENYYFYDSLEPKSKVRVPGVVNKIHNVLRIWYKDRPNLRPPIVLKPVKAKVIKEYCPLQEDDWSCAIHAHMVALATIYQGKKPVLKYTREHAYTLSRAHLHWELTGEILPCVADIVDILKLLGPQSTCVDQAIDHTHAEATALVSTVRQSLLSIIDFITNNLLILI
jgi:hypothetical protein